MRSNDKLVNNIMSLWKACRMVLKNIANLDGFYAELMLSKEKKTKL